MAQDIIPAGFFADAANPTDAEIERWAYIPGAHYPPEMEQDWDLMVTDPERVDLLERLASDLSCPNRDFFLSCLYLLVGDAVRTNGSTWPLAEARVWLSRERQHPPEDIARFLTRAKHLVAHPEDFDYQKWCNGGHAYGIESESEDEIEGKDAPDATPEQNTTPFKELLGIYLPVFHLFTGFFAQQSAQCLTHPPSNVTGPSGSDMMCLGIFVINALLWIPAGFGCVILQVRRSRKPATSKHADTARHLVSAVIGLLLLFVSWHTLRDHPLLWTVIGIAVVLNLVACGFFFMIGCSLRSRKRNDR
ncbi:MAG TPA: hypothetical protein VGE67_18770 [Haloferula sp.]